MKAIEDVVGNTCRACGQGVLIEKFGKIEVSFQQQAVEVDDHYVECNECGCMPSLTILTKEHLANLVAIKAKCMPA